MLKEHDVAECRIGPDGVHLRFNAPVVETAVELPQHPTVTEPKRDNANPYVKLLGPDLPRWNAGTRS